MALESEKGLFLREELYTDWLLEEWQLPGQTAPLY